MISLKEPLVSVVIPTYNYGHFVASAIQSVLDQTFLNIEVIVVDDGSTDTTCEVVKKFGDQILYIYQENKGLSCARNTGIKKSKGDFIAFLDSDDYWEKEKIQKQVEFIENNPEVVAVNCRFKAEDLNGKFLYVTDNEDFQDVQIFRGKLINENIIAGGGSNIIIKKSCFDEVGYFDELLSSSEDWDMWLRISKKYIIRTVEEPLTHIRVGNYSMSTAKNAQKMLDNEIIVLDKYFCGEWSFEKSRALSCRYFCAAWAFSVSGDIDKAFKKIFKGFSLYPFDYFNKKKGGLMVKIVVKKLLSMGIPVNSFSKPIFSMLYNSHVLIRELLIWFIRFFYYEPLFRAQCEKVGFCLWMEQLPYIVGKGKISIGNNVRISGKPNFGFSQKIYPDPKIVIGDATFIGHDTSFAVAKEIIIGKNCFIAGGVTISDNDGHPLDAKKRREHMPPEKDDVKGVTIGDDVWIGRQAMILKGVSIGDGAVIGARSIVVKDVPNNTVVAGNPAKVIKTLQ